MATEYKLSYTASEINEKIGLVDTHSEQITELENDIAVERARINQFVTLEEGSTVGNAELLDIRVGADGYVYDSAGEAVRQLGRTLMNETNIIPITGSNLYIPTNITPVNIQNIKTSTTGLNYILTPCEEGETFKITGSGASTGRLWTFVDSGYNVLEQAEANATEESLLITAPQYSVYLIVNYYEGSLYRAGYGLSKIDTLSKELKETTTLVNDMLIYTPTSLTWEQGGILASSGEESESSTRIRTTDFINLENIKSIKINKGYKVAFSIFDENDEYVGYYSDDGISNRAAYFQEFDINKLKEYKYSFRITMAKVPDINNILPTDGSNLEITPYTLIKEDYLEKYLNTYLGKENANKYLIVDKYGYITTKTVDDSNNIAEYISADNVSLENTYKNVISMFDTLMTNNSKFITKNALNDSSVGTVLYEYVFNTGDYNSNVGNRDYDASTKKPKVLISCGCHGDEKASVMATYLFCSALCNDYSLRKLKEQIEFRIVPVITPDAYNQSTRQNADGVNINRNFDADWEKVSGEYDNSGESPADAYETVAIQTWLLNNNDAVLYIDYHNSMRTNEVSYLATNECMDEATSKKIKKCYWNGITPIFRHWRKVRAFSEDLIFSYVGVTDTHGTSTRYANKVAEIPSVLIEASWNQNNTGRNSMETISICAEILGNTLLGLFEYFEE